MARISGSCARIGDDSHAEFLADGKGVGKMYYPDPATGLKK
ncbi:MAG TPA: hypothetical protein VK957_13905 [Lunatimonas sp.]|nr:hypothetical protein [Lunatimonas sp.]